MTKQFELDKARLLKKFEDYQEAVNIMEEVSRVAIWAIECPDSRNLEKYMALPKGSFSQSSTQKAHSKACRNRDAFSKKFQIARNKFIDKYPEIKVHIQSEPTLLFS